MKLLIKEQQELYENAKICYICKEKFEKSMWRIEKVVKLEIIVFIQGNIEVLRIAYVI